MSLVASSATGLLPTPVSEPQLFERAQAGDLAARDQLVERFVPLARSVVRRFSGSAAEHDDLFQVASFGLLKAIDRYEPSYGVAFSSFAVPTISGEVKRFLRDSSWAVRVPRGLQERSLRVESAINDLEPELRRSPSTAEIAAYIGATREEVVEAMEVSGTRFASPLDRGPANDDQPSLIDQLGTDDRGYELVDDFASAAPAFHALPAREREILQLRFGGDLTQREISRELGISQMHVSRLIRKSLDAIAQTLAA